MKKKAKQMLSHNMKPAQVQKEITRNNEDGRVLTRVQIKNMKYIMGLSNLPSTDAFANIHSLSKSPVPFTRDFRVCPTFTVVLATNDQLSLLSTFGNNFFFIDGTFEVLEENLNLTTIMISTADGLGVPVAWMISENLKTDTYKLFFKVIKKSLSTDQYQSQS